MKRKIYSFNSELDKVTGIQKVLMDIHEAVKGEYKAKIVGTVPYKKVNKMHGIKKEEYIEFFNPFMFYRSIVILHERKFLIPFWILNHILFQRIKLVYVHHSELYGWKKLSFFPKVIVAISDNGVKNLEKYFGVPMGHIHKIYNCVQDVNPAKHEFRTSNRIKVLYPARINGIKRQLEIVEHLRDNLCSDIQILFAGIGPQYEDLKGLIRDDKHFVCLGFRTDIYELLHKCDYMMLFSHHEGLSISLIEADMFGTPAICNNVGGNTEIVKDRENGFVVNDWSSLIRCLNNLTEIKKQEYLSMSHKGRQIYQDKFTFGKFKKEYLTLLNKL